MKTEIQRRIEVMATAGRGFNPHDSRHIIGPVIPSTIHLHEETYNGGNPDDHERACMDYWLIMAEEGRLARI